MRPPPTHFSEEKTEILQPHNVLRLCDIKWMLPWRGNFQTLSNGFQRPVMSGSWLYSHGTFESFAEAARKHMSWSSALNASQIDVSRFLTGTVAWSLYGITMTVWFSKATQPDIYGQMDMFSFGTVHVSIMTAVTSRNPIRKIFSRHRAPRKRVALFSIRYLVGVPKHSAFYFCWSK